jgi:hypothetical protein
MTSAPTVNSDVDLGYLVGSFWFDTTNDKAYVCLDNTDGAAVWHQIGALDKLDATAAPTASDDGTDGYSVGSIWIDVTNDTSWICVDTTTSAAVWLRTGQVSEFAKTAAPTASDDSYQVGAVWIDTTNDTAWICVDNTASTAVWLRIGVLHKLDATAAPTDDDDSGDGYQVGSIWLDVTEDVAYICLDNTSTAAVWRPITGVPLTAQASTPVTLTAESSGRTYTNEGASAEINFTLPTAAAGLEFKFIVQDTDGIQVNAATGDTIRVAGSVSAAAGNIDAATIGNAVHLVAINATEWIAQSYVGTWNVT